MIKRVEFKRGIMDNIHCPFCGRLVLDMDCSGEPGARACEHTLFIAHDYEVEYLSDALKQIFDVSEPEQLAELDSFENIDSFTDKIDLDNAIKLRDTKEHRAIMGFM